ncbi:MAG: hypothetical protein ACYS9C_18625 [Planctomycetota bacterium]
MGGRINAGLTTLKSVAKANRVRNRLGDSSLRSASPEQAGRSMAVANPFE